MVETVKSLVEAGTAVTVALPAFGPLAPLLAEAGAVIVVVPFPVLRKSLLKPRALMGLLRDVVRFLRASDVWGDVVPDRVLVNTLTVPWWVLASRLRRVPVACHVHEAEAAQPAIIRLLLAAPLLLTYALAANSASSRDVLVRSLPALHRRTVVIHNGLPKRGQVTPPRSRTSGDPLRLVQVGRLSPRKGTDIALDAVALLRQEGRDVRLRLCGAVFPGYEWFEDELRARANCADLAGSVEFLGYVSDPSLEVSDADIVLVASRVEPFGNVAVEALLAERPVVASGVQGLAEILRDGETGILVDPGSPAALAAGIGRLADDPTLSAALASTGRADAEVRFSVDQYRTKIVGLLRT